MQFESPGILKKRVYSFIVYILITHNVVRVRVRERERESSSHLQKEWKYHIITAKNENENKGCVTQMWPCHLHTSLSIFRQKKKNYGNSNISACKNIIFKKSSKWNQNPSRYYHNSRTNLKFQHKPKLSSFKNPHIKIK